MRYEKPELSLVGTTASIVLGAGTNTGDGPNNGESNYKKTGSSFEEDGLDD